MPRSGQMRLSVSPHQARILWLWLRSMTLYVKFRRIMLPDRTPIESSTIQRLANHFRAVGFRKRSSNYLAPIELLIDRQDAGLIAEVHWQLMLRFPRAHRPDHVDTICREIRLQLLAKRGRPTIRANDLAKRPDRSIRQTKRLWKRIEAEIKDRVSPPQFLGLAQYLRQM